MDSLIESDWSIDVRNGRKIVCGEVDIGIAASQAEAAIQQATEKP